MFIGIGRQLFCQNGSVLIVRRRSAVVVWSTSTIWPAAARPAMRWVAHIFNGRQFAVTVFVECFQFRRGISDFVRVNHPVLIYIECFDEGDVRGIKMPAVKSPIVGRR